MIVSIVHALWRTRRLRLTAVPWAGGAQLVVELQPNVDIRRRIEVLHGEQIAVPMTCGAMRPAILMPADVAQWSPTDVRQALIHEIEHVRRGGLVAVDHCSRGVRRLLVPPAGLDRVAAAAPRSRACVRRCRASHS